MPDRAMGVTVGLRMREPGWLLTIFGWYVIVVAVVGVFMTLKRELPAEISLAWTAYGLLVSLALLATGIWFVAWGRRLRLKK